MDRFAQLVHGQVAANWCKAALLASLVTALGCGKPASLLPSEGTGAQAPAAAAPGKSSSAVPQPPLVQAKGSLKTAQPKSTPAVLRVYYATDRARTAQSDPAKIYGNKRGELSYGYCEVSLPRTARAGKAGPPAGAPTADPSDTRPALRLVAPRSYQEQLTILTRTIARSSKRSALVFVPGYRTSFPEAARRTAQLKADLGFDGAAIFFSWPSKGRKDAYLADEAEVEWAQPDLKDFLKDLAGKTRAQNIYLVGHGMGNRALAKAFVYLASERPELRRSFREVMLVAPDIEAESFKRDLAPALAASGTRTTLYTSSRDPALRVSKKFQGAPRAGDSGANLLLCDGIETVDATLVETVLGSHAEVADNASVLADIYHLIRDGKKPAERSGLKTVSASSGQYWRFRSP